MTPSSHLVAAIRLSKSRLSNAFANFFSESLLATLRIIFPEKLGARSIISFMHQEFE